MRSFLSAATYVTTTSFETVKTYSVQHLEDFVLLAGVQPIDDDHQPRLILSEAVNGFRHPGHQFHFALKNLCEGGRQRGRREKVQQVSLRA